jgi:hypothetical protein
VDASEEERWEGISEGDGASFADAARNAAEEAERDLKRRNSWRPPHRLYVLEMSVTVTNPVHDYRVMLGTSPP